MGMSVGGAGKGAHGEINVTPLIDIVLVLLIIFMVLTPIMLKELPANVPKKSDDNTPNTGPPPIVVALSAADQLTINEDPVAPEALRERVAEKLKHDRHKMVFFKVDDDATYGRAVRYMDICKGAGALKIGIVTKDDKAGPEDAKAPAP
jgi:biopolymer transport protein ExbD